MLIEREGAVAVLTLDRPRRRNALDAQTKQELRSAIDEVASAPEVRAVILTGAGGSFCAGQDLAEHAEALRTDPAHAFDTVERDYAPIIQGLADLPKPVIAAVAGTCAGAGLALALACDLRVFAENTIFSTAFTAIGLTCDSGLSVLLPRSVGESRAKELLLLPQPFGAAEANAWGITGRVVPTDELQAEARQLAIRLAAGPTQAFAETKRLLAPPGLTEALRAEARAQARLGLTADHSRAVEDFLNRRAQPSS